jgi:pimeloyl-ACP methyl ester carboxylesterase
MPRAIPKPFLPLLLALGLQLSLAACSKPAPPPPAAAAADGSPRIVTTPDLVHLEYHVYGRGDPVILLVHGWNCNSSYWNAQIPPLAAKYTVVTLDLGGFGASGRNRSDWSMAAFGADVATVAGEFRGHPLILVGHSMGGPVVIEAARILRDRGPGAGVLGVIGVDTMKSLGRPVPPAAVIEASLAPLRADFIGETRRLISGPGFFTAHSDPVFVRKIADDMSRASPEVAIPAMLAMQTWDPAPALATLRVPLVAINSDLGTPVDEAKIRAVAPTFRLVTVPGTGHFLMMEAPERFNPILEREIEALVTGSPAPDRR